MLFFNYINNIIVIYIMKIVFYLYLFTLCNSFFRRFLPKTKNNPVIQIGFLPGSNIPIDFYDPFLESLTDKLEFDVNITKYTYFPLQTTLNNTIMIGHSFGGSISLLYCVKDYIQNTNCINSCILINSHFNHAGKMPYPKISLNIITQPVLTILGRNDEKLPYKKAIHDYEVAISEKNKNKEFITNDGNHTSCFTDDILLSSTTDLIADYIHKHM